MQQTIDKEDLYILAFSAYQSGQFEQAAQYFSSFTFQFPQEVRAWKGLAASSQMLADFPQAIYAWAAAALLDPEDTTLYFHAAECLKSLNRNEEALEALAQAKKCLLSKREHAFLAEKINTLETCCRSL